MMASARKLASKDANVSADIVGISFRFLVSSFTKYCVSMGKAGKVVTVAGAALAAVCMDSDETPLFIYVYAVIAKKIYSMNKVEQ